MNLKKKSNSNPISLVNPLMQGSSKSEYIPLFNITNWVPSFTISADRLSSFDSQNSYRKRVNEKYRSNTNNSLYRNNSIYQVLIRGLDQTSSKKTAVDYMNIYNKTIEDAIFAPQTDFVVSSHFNNNNNSYWEYLLTSFSSGNNGSHYKYSLGNTSLLVDYGYIAESMDGYQSVNTLMMFVVKKEHIPLVKASWIFDIEIPDGVVECWVLKDLLTTSHSNQTLSLGLKKNISKWIKETYYDSIPMIEKTKEELAAMWCRFNTPEFTSIPQRTSWLNNFTKGFVKAEKERLGIVKKGKYSFGSVKTGIKTKEVLIEEIEHHVVQNEVGDSIPF
jgi:hypothetical protein